MTGHNRFFAGTGAVLETQGPSGNDAAAHARWRELVIAVRRALGWADAPVMVRLHAGGTLLAIPAPPEQLLTATEVNEWAWEQASGNFEPGFNISIDPPFDQLHRLGSDVSTAAPAFRARAAAEIDPAMVSLRQAAMQRGLPLLADDSEVSLGAGAGSHTWPLTALPDSATVPWQQLHDVPTALVTGSNGKTTTVRLLAAFLSAAEPGNHGKVGYSSTEGIVIGGARGGEGDFSGPAGARTVLRDPRVEAAVLETARGGILRRGLAVDRADAAIVTNISADHFGEYGIDSLEDLADVKLVVAHALGTAGTLVLNADDPILLARAAGQQCKVALFSLTDTHAALISHRAAGGSTCGLIAEQLWLTHNGTRTLLGDILDMPLTLRGAAIINVVNIAAAVLAAVAMGVPVSVIAPQLKRFGNSRHDNPGRLNRWDLDDVTVVIDYAHNPGGLTMLMVGTESIRLEQIRNGRTTGRIGVLLGQAGNRRNDAIKELAQVAAIAKPDFIVLKEIVSMLRGRALGEVPALLRESLIGFGYPAENIHLVPDEVDAARQLLQWAQPGDVLALPVHQSAARDELATLLDELERSGWRAQSPLPSRPPQVVPGGV